jgi:adenosylmethionine-8-amino-7-oxononanoate aminotransferase
LFQEEKTLERIRAIERLHRSVLPDLSRHGEVTRARLLGTVLAFNLAVEGRAYKSGASLFLKDWYLAHGLNIRPLGPVVYLMPPYCITAAELERAYDGLFQGLNALASAR